MAKRTLKEIEKDYQRIRTVVATIPVTSIRDIAKELELTDSEVKTSLSKHPRVEKKVLKQLAKNKEEFKERKHAESVKDREHDAEYTHGFVIDASITGIESLHEILSEICTTDSKIILTSITIKELAKIQKLSGIKAFDARHIMSMALENPNSFLSVLINEDFPTPDDCILNYCANNKHRVTLITSDKEMALDAKMYNVETKYLKHSTKIISDTNNPTSSVHHSHTTPKILKLLDARKIGKKLFICITDTHYKNIMVTSNGLEYIGTNISHELKIGDDIFIATNKSGYISFAHYHLVSLSEENNCKLIYHKRLHDTTEIDNLPNSNYKSFINNFKNKYNL